MDMSGMARGDKRGHEGAWVSGSGDCLGGVLFPEEVSLLGRRKEGKGKTRAMTQDWAS